LCVCVCVCVCVFVCGVWCVWEGVDEWRARDQNLRKKRVDLDLRSPVRLSKFRLRLD